MWMLSFLPDSILLYSIFAVIASGVGLYVLGMFLGYFPSLILYRRPIGILSTLLIVAGVYFYGSYDTEMKWRARVAEVQAKVEEYKKESKQHRGMDRLRHASPTSRESKSFLV